MDTDRRSINGWFERISLIQRKADHYRLCQDILSSLSNKDGFDFYVKSKGIIIGAHTCILRCRCSRFYHDVIKKIDVGDLPINLLKRISDFIKCVYSEDDVTAYENELIKSINFHYSNRKKLLSVDLYEPKRISCDINPLYYSLAHYEDFSSGEFNDFEQCTYESVILNPDIIDKPMFGNMNINSNNSVESHVIKSESSNAYKGSNIAVEKDCILNDQCSDDFSIIAFNTDNTEKVVNAINCELQPNQIKKIQSSNNTNSFLNSKSSIECNNSLDSLTNVHNNIISPLAIENIKNTVEDCKPKFLIVDNSINNGLKNDENNPFDNDKTCKLNAETDDNIDVVSPHNFETFTVINKQNETINIFNDYNNINDMTNKINQEPLNNDSINFQTFTLTSKHLINDDNNDIQNDVIVSNEIFKPETSNDYKTFTVVDRFNASQFDEEQLCSSSNSTLSNSKSFINNNDILGLNILPSIHTLCQTDTITLSSQLNNEIKKVDDSSKDSDKCNISKFNVISTKNENSENSENIEPLNQISFNLDENVKNKVINNPNHFESSVTLNNSALCTNINQCITDPSELLYTVDDNNILNLNHISKDINNSQNNNQQLINLKSSSESDSTLSLHLDILENNKGINSPDSLNENEVFCQEDKPVVSNKLEFVPLEATPMKDNRSPRLSRKYMESSPVISANDPEAEKSLKVKENSERKNSSSFFIDFNEGKKKSKPKRFENLTKSLDSSTISTSKEKIFSMFIDFNEDSESSESSSKCTKQRKPQTLTDRFVRLHSEEANTKSNNDHENTVTPPPSRMTSTVDNSSVDISESCKKQSVFMFIENDSSIPVKRRSLPQGSRLKSQRNSWNVDSTVVHKTHHRTHSINLSEENNFDTRMTQSHIETGLKKSNKSPDSFNSVECKVTVTVNGGKNIGLTDSFVRLSDMDKAPSQEIINSLNKSESKTESLKRDLKNTELGRCLKRMFPYLKSTEVERILLSKLPHSLDNKEEIKTGLGKDLLRMFLEEIGTDTTIDINGRRIRAHKCVLTSRCQYFAAMFSGGWVQSAGNVLYLKGFSYKTVHLTLRYIYSGECNFSEIKNVAELSKLADMLCLEGLKDNIMLYLAAEYCHFFKEVCERCTIGILECLTLSVAYGLDDLYLSCIVWINDNFSVVWSTNHFATLPHDLRVKCFKHKVAHIDDLNDILSVIEGCEKIKKSLPNDEWTKEIKDLITDLSNSVIKYLAKNFYSTITSKHFKQILEIENLFADSFATHLLASCNCANRNQIRQAYDHLNKSFSNNFWHKQGEILINAIMELIVKGLATDFKNSRERQAMGSLPNDYRMSEALAKRVALELGVSGLELAANGTLITLSPVKRTINTRTLNKPSENKVKPKSIVENTPITKVKTSGKFAEIKSRYMEPKPQVTTPSPQKGSSVQKDISRSRRIMSLSTSLTSSSVKSSMSTSRLSTNMKDTGLRIKTSSELSLSTPKVKPRTILPKTDPLTSSNTRKIFCASKNTTKVTKKPVQNTINSKKMSSEKFVNGTKKPTISLKTKSLPNGHPTIGSRSGTFCKDEPTVLHNKDITS